MQATNPNLWNSWKAALLDELYGATLLALRRGLENPIDMSERIRDQKKEVLRLLRSDGPARDQIRALWRTMPEDYFLRHSADEIAWHTRAILSRPEPSTPLVLVRQLTHRGGTEIFLYTPDQDALFAATAAAIERLRLSVMEARIITSSYGYALDTYIVLEHDGNPIEDPARVAELVASIETELATPTMRIGPVQRHIPLPARHFRVHPKVEFSTDQVKRRTIVELTCSDRPGVLARVGEAFVECGVRLHNAKIATLGERVRDVFFITDHDNRPLTDSSTCARLLRTLLRNLE
jgi:[protein-PII] uridylyltransferase